MPYTTSILAEPGCEIGLPPAIAPTKEGSPNFYYRGMFGFAGMCDITLQLKVATPYNNPGNKYVQTYRLAHKRQHLLTPKYRKLLR